MAPLWSGRRRGGHPLKGPSAGAPMGKPEQPDQRLGIGDLAAPRGFVERVDARLEHVEELAGVEAALAALEAAREPDLDALVGIADGVVKDARARPFAGAVAGLLDQLAHGAVEHRLARLELAGRELEHRPTHRIAPLPLDDDAVFAEQRNDH